MARLETAVLPLLLPTIEGFAVELSTEEQITVARWAVLKAAVFEHIWAHDPVLTAADREMVRTRNRPPAGVQVRLARAEPGGCALRAHGLVFEPRRHDEKAISVLITLGCLVAEVTGGPGPGTHASLTAGAPGTALTAGAPGTGFITIFPPQAGSVRWPPPDTLDVGRLLPEVTPWLPGTAGPPRAGWRASHPVAPGRRPGRRWPPGSGNRGRRTAAPHAAPPGSRPGPARTA